MMHNPLIIDLLPLTKTIIPSNNVPVIGKFEGRSTSSLGLSLCAIRAAVIVGEIKKWGQIPEPVQFYIDECWQAFLIVNTVVHRMKFDAKDVQILVMTSEGSLVVFGPILSLEGGDELQGQVKVQSYVIPQFPDISQTEATNE